MKIISLELKNFRNYKSARVEFNDGLNVLFGENASGKTNLLESIYLCSIFKSPRTTRDKELVLLGEQSANIKIVVEKKYRKHVINLQIDNLGHKKVAVDGLPVNRAGELIGVLGVVFFSPDEMKLIKESPQERRHFLDVGLCQQQKSYFTALQRYNKTLKQKNNLLKEYRGGANIDDMLDVWDAGLAKEGATIINKRIEYLKTLDDAAGKFHSAISKNKENLHLIYENSILNVQNQNVEEALLAAIKAARQKDRELGFCTVGPHRDDIKIDLDGKDGRKFASQGQQRTIALAMKLGEVVIYRNELGEPPVLLLDDVLSELDEGRQALLLKMTEGFQTVLTCTEYELPNAATKFKIVDGTINKQTK